MIEEPIQDAPQRDFYVRLPGPDNMPTALAAFYRQDTKTEVDDETGEETVVNVGEPYFVPNTPDYAIDVVGTMYRPTGAMLTDENGNEYPEMAPLDGWHVNIRLLNDERRADVRALEPYLVVPKSPARVWL